MAVDKWVKLKTSLIIFIITLMIGFFIHVQTTLATNDTRMKEIETRQETNLQINEIMHENERRRYDEMCRVLTELSTQQKALLSDTAFIKGVIKNR